MAWIRVLFNNRQQIKKKWEQTIWIVRCGVGCSRGRGRTGPCQQMCSLRRAGTCDCGIAASPQVPRIPSPTVWPPLPPLSSRLLLPGLHPLPRHHNYIKTRIHMHSSRQAFGQHLTHTHTHTRAEERRFNYSVEEKVSLYLTFRMGPNELIWSVLWLWPCVATDECQFTRTINATGRSWPRSPPATIPIVYVLRIHIFTYIHIYTLKPLSHWMELVVGKKREREREREETCSYVRSRKR